MPRSPSRDLSDRFIGKRGYFRHPDAIRRGKYLFAGLAFAFAVGWAAVDIFQPTQTAYAHSHGPIASPHAAFDDNCAACHVGQSIDLNPLSVFRARDRWHDLTCGKCHAGPNEPDFAHHASANEAAKEFHKRCSNCHHDHLGRLNSLVRLSDTDCNQCHSDLGKWHDASKSKSGTPYQNTIASFATNHPEFRSLDLAKKPRTLTFSHALHMNPGQAYVGGKEAMTVARLRTIGGDAAVERYAPGRAPEALVELACSSCHKLDSGAGTVEFDKLKGALDAAGDPTQSLLPPRAEGAYFLPMNFDVSCRACHPLAANEGTNKTNELALVLPRFDLPHRKQPNEIRAVLKAGYVKELIANGHQSLKEPQEPGGPLAVKPKGTPPTLSQEADRLTERAERLLLTGKDGCLKCHKTESVANEATGTMLRIAPVPDRTVWFTHAKFNHAAHRGTTCATCHPNTGKASIEPLDANKPEEVQILGVKSCRACHAPAGTPVELPDGSKVAGGGVRAACTDCHRYHHGDMPMQGRGSAARYPKDPRTLADWLKGK